MAAPDADRLDYLDWLKFFVVLSLAPFHAAISYTGVGQVFVYGESVRNAVVAAGGTVEMGPAALRLFIAFMDNWFMHLLFLISGIGASFSLRRRRPGDFMKERANRLLVPYLVCVLVVVAFQAWLRALSVGTFSGGFLAFYPHFFNGIHSSPASSGNFEWGHAWFLVYLFVFSALALPFFKRVKARGPFSRILSGAGRAASGLGIFVPALWIALLEALFRPGWPGFLDLVWDWANFTVYLSFFVMGFLAGSEPRLLEAVERNRLAALALGLLAFLARLATLLIFSAGPGYNPANIAAQALRGIAAYCLVVFFLGFGRKRLRRSGRALAWAKDLSFPLYLLHFAPVSAAVLLMYGTGLPLWTQWAIASCSGWAFVAAFTAFARYIPCLRSLFGIAAPKRLDPGPGK